MDLVFDTTSPRARTCARRPTRWPSCSRPHGPSGKQVPPLVEFGWGVYRFTGMVEQYKETLDLLRRERRAAALQHQPHALQPGRRLRQREEPERHRRRRPHARAGHGADVERSGRRAVGRRQLARRPTRRARDRLGQRCGQPALLRRSRTGGRRRRRRESRRGCGLLRGCERRLRGRRVGRRRTGNLGRRRSGRVGRCGLRRVGRRIGRIRRGRRRERGCRRGIRSVGRLGGVGQRRLLRPARRGVELGVDAVVERGAVADARVREAAAACSSASAAARSRADPRVSPPTSAPMPS